MKRAFAALLFVGCMMVAAISPAPVDASDQEKTAQALIAMEHKWAAAMLTGDRRTVEQMLADDFIQTNSSGRKLSRAEALDNVAQSAQKLASSSLSDMNVRVYGKTAVVSGMWSGEMRGSPARINERWTDTWVKQSGKWKCVTSHSSEIKN